MKRLHAACFVAATVAIVWLYDYARVAELGPVSEHAWRQADGASLALSYYERGMRFFEPQVHNALRSGDGHAAAELPLLYYAAAGLYHVFGPDDALFRVLNFAVLLTGLFLFSRALLRWVDDVWLALFPPLFLLGSPLLAFYGFNFLPNTTALGLLLIAASLLLDFAATERLARFWAAAAVMACVSLLKVTFLVPFLAFVGAALLVSMRAGRTERPRGVPPLTHLVAATAVVLGASVAWYVWARDYNARHESTLFLLGPRPVWSFSLREIVAEIAFVARARKLRGFDSGGTILLVVTTWVVLRARSLPDVVKWTLRLALLGAVAYLALFFGQLHHHDYYLIDLLPCVALVLALGVWVLKHELPWIAQSSVVRLTLVLLVGANLLRTDRILAKLYTLDSYRIPPAVVSLNKRDQLRAFLDDFGIGPDERVLVLGDESPNLSLYYLDRRGWTHRKRNLGPRALAKYRAKGARYLVVLAPPRRTKTGGSPFPTAKPIALFDGRIQFYDLAPPPEKSESSRPRIVVH